MADVKTYENYYFEDDELLFQPGGATVHYGALVKMRDAFETDYGTIAARWEGLPISPMNYHPAAPASVPRLTAKRRAALAEVLASTQGEMERVSAI